MKCLWRPGSDYVMLAAMNLRDLGARARLCDATGDDVGYAHMPRPVEPGDLAALDEGPPLEMVAVVDLEPGGKVDVLAQIDRMPRHD